MGTDEYDKLVLIGGGGHCRSVLDSILASHRFGEIVITDETMEQDSMVMGCRVIGTDAMLPELRAKGFEYAFISVGSIKSPELRIRLAKMATGMGFHFPVICDPTARVSPFAVIGEGAFIGKGVILNAESEVGRHCIINSGAVLEHGSRVEEFSHVSVGSIICGNSHIGLGSFIGAGSIVIQDVSIGNHVIIGAGSTVLSDVGDDMKCYGIVSESSICQKEKI